MTDNAHLIRWWRWRSAGIQIHTTTAAIVECTAIVSGVIVVAASTIAWLLLLATFPLWFAIILSWTTGWCGWTCSSVGCRRRRCGHTSQTAWKCSCQIGRMWKCWQAWRCLKATKIILCCQLCHRPPACARVCVRVNGKQNKLNDLLGKMGMSTRIFSCRKKTSLTCRMQTSQTSRLWCGCIHCCVLLLLCLLWYSYSLLKFHSIVQFGFIWIVSHLPVVAVAADAPSRICHLRLRRQWAAYQCQLQTVFQIMDSQPLLPMGHDPNMLTKAKTEKKTQSNHIRHTARANYQIGRNIWSIFCE